MAWKNKISNILRIIVSLVLIIWLLKYADETQIANSLAGANLFFVGLLLVTANLDRFLMAYKWNILLAAKGIHIPLVQVISSYYKASFLGSFFLPTVGADAFRIYEITKQAKRPDDVISSVVVERFVGLVAILLSGILGLSLFVSQVDRNQSATLVQSIFLLGLISAVFVFSFRLDWLLSLAGRLPISKWSIYGKLEKIARSYQDYSNHAAPLFVFFAWSILEQFILIINSYLMAKAFNFDIPLLYFFMFIPIIVLIVRLPISFDGFGVREGLYVYLFSLVGVPEAQAFLVSIVTSIVVRLGVAPLSLFFFLTTKEAPKTLENERSRLIVKD